jgi:hypothetical protein
MNRFLRAHGYEAGPTQRPRLAGALAGAIAELPTVAIMLATDAWQPLLRAVGLSVVSGFALHFSLVLLGGGLYGQLFQRAANDRNGGWLFGLAFGFLGWMAGPVTALEWIMGRPVIAGAPAQGLFAAYLLWGLCLGLLFPHVHRRLQADLDDFEPCSGSRRRDRPGPRTS